MFFPVSEIFLVKLGKLRRYPRFRMNPVGDACDRHFIDRDAGPDIFPKRPAHITVQPTYAVSQAADPQGQDSHAEWIVRVYSVLPKREQFVDRDVQVLGELPELFP